MNKRQIWRRRLLQLAGCGGIVLAVYVLDILCPVRYVTGVPCPFCGMTRAWLAALRGDVAAALRFHPLFLLGPPLLLAAVWGGAGPQGARARRVWNGALIAGAALFFVLYLFRLAAGTIL